MDELRITRSVATRKRANQI
ncbi:unnamed protein product [Cuscuta epithymum]|uniref:Uncharacterized protein n=1 Tax=Cuscuta epithymum TaxID=186058 RepID=A0AAV0CC89_9ASTE|nr:unnamed protein product [Cuscuta epithymum]